ncbi:MAG: hypothetical protein JSU00_11425 [Acidobacteria bacterium]|nr:hypothetical protein [Acidobacteriota bacterium]
MLYQRRRRYTSAHIAYLHVEQERNQTRITGGATDGFLRLCDGDGNVWSGPIEKGPDGQYRCRLRDAFGGSMTGTAESGSWTFRDDQGNIWKGFAS